MSRGIDRLFDLLSSQSQWSTTMPTSTVSLVKIPTTEEMSILPDTANGPMLQISKKNADGEVVYMEKMNLPAIDDRIGKLIKMRDLVAAMTEKRE